MKRGFFLGRKPLHGVVQRLHCWGESIRKAFVDEKGVALVVLGLTQRYRLKKPSQWMTYFYPRSA